MDNTIIDTQQKVTERLIYEGILLHNQYQPRRWKIHLKEVIEAGKKDTRILEVLPAILKLKPKVISKAKQDLQLYPDLKKLVLHLSDHHAPHQWRGISINDLRKQLRRLHEIFENKKQKIRYRNINIRVSQDDLERLEQLASLLGPRSKSSLIRYLIANAPQNPLVKNANLIT